jgi:hypothetical protein
MNRQVAARGTALAVAAKSEGNERQAMSSDLNAEHAARETRQRANVDNVQLGSGEESGAEGSTVDEVEVEEAVGEDSDNEDGMDEDEVVDESEEAESGQQADGKIGILECVITVIIYTLGIASKAVITTQLLILNSFRE